MTSVERDVEYEVDSNGCWICTSHAQNGKGYVYLKRDGVRISGHRYSYIKHKGEIPDGMVVRHKCDVRNCINPDHLIIGTQADNVNDRVSRNRGACGEGINTSKLTTEQVEFIRNNDDMNGIELAKLFGVHNATIYRARNSESWKHIKSTN